MRFVFPFTLAMIAFLEDSADIERLLSQGDVEGAIVTTVLASTQESGVEEPWLRDARSNLLGSVLVCLSTLDLTDDQMLGATALHGLLERRIFNWINKGDGRIETHLFPMLFSTGASLYDGGFDADWQHSVNNFIRVSGPFPEDYKKWLEDKAFQVTIAKEKRIIDIAGLQVFRIGQCVRAEGLRTATQLNNQLGVITNVLGNRRAVIFPDIDGVKAVKISNMCPVSLVSVPVDRNSRNSQIYQMVESKKATWSSGGEALGNFRDAVSWAEEEGFDRADVLARVSFLKQAVGGVMLPCGIALVPEDLRTNHLRLLTVLRRPCVGTCVVNLNTLSTEQSRREWLVSGLCKACQEAFLV